VAAARPQAEDFLCVGRRQLLPPRPDPVVGGAEAAVEVVPRTGRPDDRVQRYRVQSQLSLAAAAERVGDLVERHEAVAVAVLAAQPVGQRGQKLASSGPQEVVVDVGPGESGIEHWAAFLMVLVICAPARLAREATRI